MDKIKNYIGKTISVHGKSFSTTGKVEGQRYRTKKGTKVIEFSFDNGSVVILPVEDFYKKCFSFCLEEVVKEVRAEQA